MHGATYPYAIKNQRKARKPLVWGFGCLELVLYGIRELAQHHYELLGNVLSQTIFLHPGPKLAALVVAGPMEVTPLQRLSVTLLAAAAIPAKEALTP